MLLRAKITIKIDISNKYPEKMILPARFYIIVHRGADTGDKEVKGDKEDRTEG